MRKSDLDWPNHKFINVYKNPWEGAGTSIIITNSGSKRVGMGGRVRYCSTNMRVNC